jgi:hypothetical protein
MDEKLKSRLEGKRRANRRAIEGRIDPTKRTIFSDFTSFFFEKRRSLVGERGTL